MPNLGSLSPNGGGGEVSAHTLSAAAWADLADYCPGVTKGGSVSAKEIAKRLKKRD